MNIVADEATKKYFEFIKERSEKQFNIASKAKAKGIDISTEVESPPTLDLADRTENIIGPKGIADRYRTLSAEKSDRNRVIFQIFKEIIQGDLGDIKDNEKRLEQAVKSALVLVTEGVVVAPLDGVPKVKISKNPDGTKYVDIYFAGPIRAAGGTATVFPLILGDYARQLMGLDKYKPTEDEVERYVEEINIYDEIITRQYKLKDDEVRKIVKGCPVCVNGEPTEEREVSNYKDLERIPSNRIRGGMCLVISEGVGLKAMKIMSLAKILGLNWDWLEDIIKIGKSGGSEKKTIKPNYNYLGRIAAGRPIFSYPSKYGGFRLRYGRARNTCVMGKGMHPATMHLLDNFIAVGTQTKMERPGKSAEMFPVDTIEGPIVRLKSGEVVKIRDFKKATEVKEQVEEILFLGDVLIALGDFRKTAHPLIPVGYCEEWWKLELEKALTEKKLDGIDTEKILLNPNKVDEKTALEVSIQLGIALHPEYTHYYTALEPNEISELIGAVRKAEKKWNGDEIEELLIEKNDSNSGFLERIGIPHKVTRENFIVGKEYAYSFFRTLGGLNETKPEGKNVLEILRNISGLKIRDKGGSFIGCRMGRPEAAKPRKMVGDPMALFPVGFYGTAIRSINKAAEKFGKIETEIAEFVNEKGEIEEQIFSKGKRNMVKKNEKGEIIHSKREINIEKILHNAAKNLNVTIPPLVKGVKGLINAQKIPEPLEKGILRARHDLHIFRDGTIRYELLNAPLTHFKPREIGLSVKRAIELGYTKDYLGNELESEEQICELFVQDMVVNEGAGEFFVKVTKFIDEELEKLYEGEKYYNYNKKEDLIGELFLGLAPHTSAAVVGRIIGYTKAKLNFAHPYFHLSKRRNCDGDQDSIMLLMDALINFSHSYLPSSRGGRMDAPLVYTIAINPLEIDDEVYEVETCYEYPLEVYEKAEQYGDPEFDSIVFVKDKIGKENQYQGFGFTHHTETFDKGPKKSQYVALQSMEEKIKSQAIVQGKIRAVEKKDALERVMMSHFMPDIIGNARAFSRQTFRCSKCNTKYRRVPLSGICNACGSDTLILTIAQGSVRKYLEIAKEIVNTYDLSPYLKQRIELIEKEIDSVFVNDKVQQKSLFEFV